MLCPMFHLRISILFQNSAPGRPLTLIQRRRYTVISNFFLAKRKIYLSLTFLSGQKSIMIYLKSFDAMLAFPGSTSFRSLPFVLNVLLCATFFVAIAGSAFFLLWFQKYCFVMNRGNAEIFHESKNPFAFNSSTDHSRQF